MLFLFDPKNTLKKIWWNQNKVVSLCNNRSLKYYLLTKIKIKMENVTHLTEMIETLFQSKPNKRKELKEWKIAINELINIVNKLSKKKIYSKQ